MATKKAVKKGKGIPADLNPDDRVKIKIELSAKGSYFRPEVDKKKVKIRGPRETGFLTLSVPPFYFNGTEEEVRRRIELATILLKNGELPEEEIEKPEPKKDAPAPEA